MEDLFLRDEMEFLVQPEHFQSIFGFIGILYSIGLIVALCDIFLNPNFGFYRLMIKGGQANFSSSDFKRDFFHQYLLKS